MRETDKNDGLDDQSWQDQSLFCDGLPSVPCPEIGKILVTGASGYIGGRLVPELQARSYQVRAMVRAKSAEQEELWPGAEVVVADVLEPASLREALRGVHTAYYLIHSLLLGPRGFAAVDIAAATNFRKAAEEMGVRRLIYLGGLGDVTTELSQHLRSRIEVEEELRRGAVPTTALRAAIIIGSGSASYEIIRHLAVTLSVLPVPRWARNRCQPIAIRDVVKYLVGVLETPDTVGRSYDIGGKDILTYEEMLREAATLFDKRVFFPPAPLSNAAFFAYIASLLTPVPAPITRCLFHGLRNEVVCQDDAIRAHLPFETIGYGEAVLRALYRERADWVETRWSDAYPPAHRLALRLGELRSPPRYVSVYSLKTPKESAALFESICKIGGKEGWFWNNWMWRLRGTIDRILLGVGSARGRKSNSALRVNDVIDFWRVEDLQADRRLLLRAEMKLPGRAWLEFNIKDQGEERVLGVAAYYATNSLAGFLYWHAFLPLHHFIFTHLLEQIEARS